MPRGSIAPISPYHPDAGIFDEALEADGSPRPPYGDLLAVLERTDLGALAAALAEDVAASGVSFRADGGEGDSFCLDAVPRLLEAETWAGAGTRPDAKGSRSRPLRCRRLRRARHRRCRGGPGAGPGQLRPPRADAGRVSGPAVRIAVAGLDVVRDAKGDFRVLEDNVRTPPASPTRWPPGRRSAGGSPRARPDRPTR